ncbi:DHA2 family efflux MFS transporter permease subunit [soil metagenome]
MSVLNTTMINVALPTIRDVFDVTEADSGRLATLYSLFFGIMTPFYGRLGDRYGLRRMYIFGMLFFGASSLLATIVPTSAFSLLVLLRVGQGIGSAAIPPLGTALIMRTIPSARRGASIGLIAAAVGAGQAVGPTLGGALTEYVSWRGVFLVSAFIVVLIPLQYRMFPGKSDAEPKPVDWLGGVALAGTIGGVLISVEGIQAQGIASLQVLLAASIAAIALIVTIMRQRSVRFPFIDRELLTNRRYVYYSVTAFMMMSAGISILILMPFLLEDVNGLPTAQVGLVLLSQAVVVTFFSRPIGSLADRYDAVVLSSIGLAVVLAVTAVLMTVAVGWPVWALVPLLLVFGAGQASTFSPLQTTVTRVIPRRLAGTAIGIYNMMFFVGASFGAAISTGLLSARQGEAALLPIYAGPAEYSYFGDAFLYGFCAALAGIVLLQFARRSPNVMEGREE